MKGDKGESPHLTITPGAEFLSTLPGLLVEACASTASASEPVCYEEIYTDVKVSFSNAEFTGTLNGFDDYVNMVLEDVTEL